MTEKFYIIGFEPEPPPRFLSGPRSFKLKIPIHSLKISAILNIFQRLSVEKKRPQIMSLSRISLIS